MSLLAFRMTIVSPMLESTTSGIRMLASFFFQTFLFCNGHSSFEASINLLRGYAICNTFSLGIPGWRQYWSALMLMPFLLW